MVKKLIMAIAAGAAVLAAGPVAIAADGKEVYAKTCAVCHTLKRANA